ncbi:hypothetical protein HELRODRAFT_111616 [Helobdella robusta]|uniref:RRM domain-containing protein n=1 Tax=Helobdella robusta TaxID=6412 RepID=T1EFC9_HELRO|nr:hypothetical protein HELRODRAFT_111616 [Helobdella robusta]ESO04596.1 hypothetical protein HELRODRAFT_111616 [Helobdella robusta]
MSNDYDGGQMNGKGVNENSKIFVGGLARETTDEDLRNYFSSFGTVLECNLKRDFTTGVSRGFAFVSFEDPNAVDLVVAKSTHILGGKAIDPKRLKSKNALEGCTKVFVGGVDPNLPESDIREYFQQFGKIESMDLPYDKEKNQRRGFCFINFESSDAVDMLCTKSKHPLGEREVDVKRATPQDPKMGAFKAGMRGGSRAGGGMPFGMPDYGARGGRGGGGGSSFQAQPAAVGGYPPYYNYAGYYGQQAVGVATAAGGYAAAAGGYGFGGGYSTDSYSGYQAANGRSYGMPKAGMSNGKTAPTRGGFNDRYQPY